MSTALKAALQSIGDYVGASGQPAHLLIGAKCRALLCGYYARWGTPCFEIASVEELVQSDLYNPETKAKSRTFSVAGKLDLTATRSGRRVIFDHKTTSEDIKDPASPYWRQLVVESQPSHYMLLEWLNGRKVDEAVWDVMRKPDIRPRKLERKEREAVTFSQRYFGNEVSAEAISEMQATEREPMEMYEYRLIHDCTVERPEHYFQRRTVPRMDADIHEHAAELWAYSQEIIMARRENRHPRNSGACMNYGRACKFLGICSGYDSPESGRWQRKQQVHNELVLLGTDGRDVLTNSRLTSFKTCRRKHWFEYELGIERVDEDEAESLWFGSCWHAALEVYFDTFRAEQASLHFGEFAFLNQTEQEIGQ